MKQRNSA